jgi:hypothetical protein
VSLPAYDRTRPLIWLLIGGLAVFAAMRVPYLLPRYGLLTQDVPIFAIIGVLVFLFYNHLHTSKRSQGFKWRWGEQRTVIAMMLILIIIGCTGHSLIMHRYAFSRDEQMVLQDAGIFASGRWFGWVPRDWHGLEMSLNRTFNTANFGPYVTLSDYRPFNALIHALPLSIGWPVWIVTPVLSATAAGATWSVSKRLWPNDPEPRLVAMVLFATSVQIWALSMTPYAMSALLALNMIWLALYLRGGVTGHGLALIIGFVGTGLHQIFYHPAFAFPFLCLLLRDRRWALATVYAVAYAAIILFWFRYTAFQVHMTGLPLEQEVQSGLKQASKLAALLAEMLDPSNASVTVAHIIRFFAWEHLLLLPLLMIGIGAAVRTRQPLLIAMAAAFFLPFLAKAFLIPYQGHGWGYRYAHGVIGLACLLGAAGWHTLSQQLRAPKQLFIVATALTLMASAPWLLWRASVMSGAYAKLDRLVAAQTTDMVMVDAHLDRFEQDVVINDHNLKKRPIRLLVPATAIDAMPRLCATGRIAFIPGAQIKAPGTLYGFKAETSRDYNALLNEAQRLCPENVYIVHKGV